MNNTTNGSSFNVGNMSPISDNANMTPQEVAAFYANAMNAKQIINSRRMHNGTGHGKK